MEDFGKLLKNKVNQFYTAPTAIRALQVHGTAPIEKFDLSSPQSNLLVSLLMGRLGTGIMKIWAKEIVHW